MKLLIVRHADAGDANEFARTGQSDDLRPLSDEGRSRMRAIARVLRELAPKVDLIVTSPLVRAVQTAELLCEAYGTERPEVSDALRYTASLTKFEKWLKEHDSARLVSAVGHAPHLDALATRFAAGPSVKEPIVELKKGGACLLEFDGGVRAGGAIMRWVITPSQLEKMAR